MDEELVQNDVMDEKNCKELRNECQNSSEGCDGSVHILNWWMEQFFFPTIKNCWKNLLMGMNLGC